jgi:hypothetical protein
VLSHHVGEDRDPGDHRLGPEAVQDGAAIELDPGPLHARMFDEGGDQALDLILAARMRRA